MGASSSPLWRFMISDEMNDLTANLSLVAGLDTPLPPPSTHASSTQTPDNTGRAVVGGSIGMAFSRRVLIM